MNERIRELAIQSIAVWNAERQQCEVEPDELEKFAELIVRECIDCMNPLSRNHSMVGAAQDTIKEHFGVK